MRPLMIVPRPMEFGYLDTSTLVWIDQAAMLSRASASPQPVGHWTEKTTTGIARRLHLDAARYPVPSRALVDLVEAATIALRDYSEALDGGQHSWSELTALDSAAMFLVTELSDALNELPDNEYLERSKLFNRCERAVNAVSEALVEMKRLAFGVAK